MTTTLDPASTCPSRAARAGGIAIKVLWVALYVSCLAALILASQWVGFLFGFLAGDSQTSVTRIAIELIFGLLAVIGIGVSNATIRKQVVAWSLSFSPTIKELSEPERAALEADLHRERLSSAVYALVAAASVTVFCSYCYAGLADGVRNRLDKYVSYAVLIGPETWKATDTETAATLYRFRVEMQRQRVPSRDFECFVTDVIKPVLTSRVEMDEKQEAIVTALEIFEGKKEIAATPTAQDQGG